MSAARGIIGASVRRGALAGLAVFALVLASAAPALAAGHGGGIGKGGGGGKPGGGSTLSVTNPGEQMATQGVSTSLQIRASHPTGDILSYALSSQPTGLTIDSTTGLITGTPTTAEQIWVTVTVTDTSNPSLTPVSTAFWWFVNAGYDVSYPQCSSPLPPAGALGIVGVTDGIVYSANPCLSTELSWAKNAPALYVNTGDPGPDYSSKWPVSSSVASATENGQTCTFTDANSTACSYVYGWRAAQDAFSVAAAVAGSATVAGLPWWLDVETGNSWQTLEPRYGNTGTSQDNDLAALRGMSDYLTTQGVQNVGIYSTASAWNAITGGPANPLTTDASSGFPATSTRTWVPTGVSYTAGFAAGCTQAMNFLTGSKGGISLYQYTVPINGTTFDADYPCP